MSEAQKSPDHPGLMQYKITNLVANRDEFCYITQIQ